jgi:flagellin-specific chaperone FliS
MTTDQETPQDDLENKISEAELKAQEQAPEETNQAEITFENVSEGDSEEVLQEKQELSRIRKIWRRILIWLVVIAVAFAGGFFVDSTLRYQPALSSISALELDVTNLQTEIESLESEIERLGAFEEKNTELTAEITQLNLHLVILSLRASVADASLAIEQDRIADARLALDKVGSTLDYLKTLLNDDQGEIVDSMIQRYQLVMVELDNDGSTVLTDLDLLTTRLLTLENTLFSTP